MAIKAEQIQPSQDAAAKLIRDAAALHLVCNKCDTLFVFDEEMIGEFCQEQILHKGHVRVCSGTLRAWVETKKGAMIKLPDQLKSTKHTPQQQTGWNGTSAYGGGGTGGYTYKSCKHTGEKVVFEYKGKKLFGANSSSLNEYSGMWGLIIDLAGIVSSLGHTSAFVGDWKTTEKYKAALSPLTVQGKVVPSEYLRLNWTDMGVPPVGLAFWLKLWEMIPEKTVMGCMGGHGRTGTALASFMISAGVDYYTAVQTVRTEHCEKAIENLAQEKYLHNLYLENLYMLAADADTTGEELIELEKDIAYAKAHVPTQQSSYGQPNDTSALQGSKKGSSGGNLITYPKQPAVVIGSTSTGTVGASSTHTVGGLSNGEPVVSKAAEAGMRFASMKMHSMPMEGDASTMALPKMRTDTDGSQMVEECRQLNCPEWVCMNEKHLMWVKWEDSYTQYEFEPPSGKVQ